jgi:D-2-hydroxyacid dehydrogenase (NADP+)
MAEQSRKLLWPSVSRLAYLDVPAWVEQSLYADFPEFSIVIVRDEHMLETHLPDCEIYVSWTLRAEQFALCRRLRWIHSPSAGVTQLLLPGVKTSDIVITNGRTVHAIPVAEHAVSLMFALARHLPHAMRLQSEHRWGQESIWNPRRLPTEVNGKTLGLVGIGSIGQEIAVRAKALGMRVIAVRRDATRGAPNVDAVYSRQQLPEVLEQIDYLILTVPDTPETTQMIRAEHFAKMKPTAFLINVARGSLVNSADLIAALERGTIAGAGLDVTDPEPLGSDDPLWEAPNVLITHHVGGATERFWPRQFELLKENLRRYIAGEALLNVVDKQRGY